MLSAACSGAGLRRPGKELTYRSSSIELPKPLVLVRHAQGRPLRPQTIVQLEADLDLPEHHQDLPRLLRGLLRPNQLPWRVLQPSLRHTDCSQSHQHDHSEPRQRQSKSNWPEPAASKVPGRTSPE